MKKPSGLSKKKADADKIEELKNQLSETKRKLLQSEQRLEAVMNNSLDAIVLLDKDFHLLYMSDAAFKISGRTPKEIDVSQPLIHIHPEDQPIVRQKLAQTLPSTTEPLRITFRTMHKQGHFIWVEGVFKNMLKTKGVNAIVLILRDVTSEKESEHRIAAGEEQFRMLIERISDAFIAFDKDLRYTFVNKKAGEITQMNPKDMIGKHVWDLFPDAVGTSTYKAFNKAMRDQIYISNTDYFEPLDLWQENHLYPSADGLSVFIRDVSERKRVERKLMESEQRFRTLIENSNDAILLLDESGKVFYQSPSVERITGVSLAYRLANPDTQLTHPDDLPLMKEVVQNSRANPRMPVPFQVRVRHPQGHFLWIEGLLTNQLDDPNVKAMVFNYRDITERKDAEAQILKLNNELEEKVEQRTKQLDALNKELESFTYSVSHDLRAPLRIIDGFSNILVEDLGDKLEPQDRKNLDVIVTNVKRMGMLIDDLLNFSRIGKEQIQVTDINMRSLVSEVLEEIALSNTPVPENLTVETLPPARGDARLLKQVWINLISNAIKYSSKKEKPEIVIGSYPKNNQMVYFVKDNGAGFDMQYAHKLFGVFQRLHKITEFPGTGVGLALVQRVISRHEGGVWAEGKLNEGATFYFSLPA